MNDEKQDAEKMLSEEATPLLHTHSSSSRARSRSSSPSLTFPPPPLTIGERVTFSGRESPMNRYDFTPHKVLKRDSLAISLLQNPRYLTQIPWQEWVFLLVAIPTAMVLFILTIIWLASAESPQSVAKVIIAYCSVMSCVITGWLMFIHLRSYTKPGQQRPILRILVMIPVYSLSSWWGFHMHGVAPAYLNLFRDCYEAYVLYNFAMLLIDYLGGEHNVILCLEEHETMKHPFPLCWLPPLRIGALFYTRMRKCCIQYMLVHPICNAIALLFSLLGIYEEGTFSFHSPWVYVEFIDNISITFTATALVYFYVACNDELQPYKPFKKFLCIKAVIVLSFWQAIIVAWLIQFNVVKVKVQINIDAGAEVKNSLLNFLVAVEMLFIAFGFYYAFPVAPYEQPTGVHTKVRTTIKHSIQIDDVQRDVRFLLVPWGTRRVPDYGSMDRLPEPTGTIHEPQW